MKQDEIIELVQEAGIVQFNDGFIDITKAELDKFAKLVADKEREACAKVCDSFYESWINIYGRYEFMGEGAQECAAAIRARGQA
jgi:hypothetical protein